jgi:hypothetical protein
MTHLLYKKYKTVSIEVVIPNPTFRSKHKGSRESPGIYSTLEFEGARGSTFALSSEETVEEEQTPMQPMRKAAVSVRQVARIGVAGRAGRAGRAVPCVPAGIGFRSSSSSSGSASRTRGFAGALGVTHMTQMRHIHMTDIRHSSSADTSIPLSLSLSLPLDLSEEGVYHDIADQSLEQLEHLLCLLEEADEDAGRCDTIIDTIVLHIHTNYAYTPILLSLIHI